MYLESNTIKPFIMACTIYHSFRYCDAPGSPCLSKKRVKCTVPGPFLFFKDPWPCVLSLPGAQGGLLAVVCKSKSGFDLNYWGKRARGVWFSSIIAAYVPDNLKICDLQNFSAFMHRNEPRSKTRVSLARVIDCKHYKYPCPRLMSQGQCNNLGKYQGRDTLSK